MGGNYVLSLAVEAYWFGMLLLLICEFVSAVCDVGETVVCSLWSTLQQHFGVGSGLEQCGFPAAANLAPSVDLRIRNERCL